MGHICNCSKINMVTRLPVYVLKNFPFSKEKFLYLISSKKGRGKNSYSFVHPTPFLFPLVFSVSTLLSLSTWVSSSHYLSLVISPTRLRLTFAFRTKKVVEVRNHKNSSTRTRGRPPRSEYHVGNLLSPNLS